MKHIRAHTKTAKKISLGCETQKNILAYGDILTDRQKSTGSMIQLKRTAKVLFSVRGSTKYLAYVLLTYTSLRQISSHRHKIYHVLMRYQVNKI